MLTPLDGALRYTVSTEFTANSGNFESRKVGGSLAGTFDVQHDPEAVGEYLYDRLYRAINDELNAAKIYAENNEHSMIHCVPTTD